MTCLGMLLLIIAGRLFYQVSFERNAFSLWTCVVNLLHGLWIGEAWGRHLLDVGVLVRMLVLGVVISAKTFH